MRIALVGRGSTGKTTLVHKLSERLGLPVISECIRTAKAELGIGSLDDISTELRVALQFLALQRQVSLEAAFFGSGFASDRSIHCYTAYFRRFPGIPNDCAEAYKRLTAGCKGYTHLVLVPRHSGGFSPDGTRLDQERFGQLEQDVEDELALRVLRSREPRGIVLKSDTVDDRVEEILNFVKVVPF